jgi:hypothetical protein
MSMKSRYAPLALAALALGACAQNAGPASSPVSGTGSAANTVPAGDWVERAAATVRMSNDPYDLRDCEFITGLTVPDGWDGELKSMTPTEERALQEMKLATVRAGGNFLLLHPGPEPLGEAYLCTE